MLRSPLDELHEVGPQLGPMLDDANGLEDQGVLMLGRGEVGSGGHLQELRNAKQLGLVNVHGQILEDVMGTQTGGVLFPVRVLQEHLYALLELLVGPAQLLVNNCDYLVVVLHPEQHVV